MNENPIIGVYAQNQEALPVYFDPVSREAFYEDEMGAAYLLTGFDLRSPDEDNAVFDTFEEMLAATPDNIVGIIKDGDTAWLLRDDHRCFRVPMDNLTVAASIQAAEYEDDMEYEPEGEDDV